MKTVEKYIDEISGKEFGTIKEAIASEKRNGGLKKLFAFWKKVPKDKHCNFANGGHCYLRSDHEYWKFVDSLIKAIKDYEPWIASQYDSDGGLARTHVKGGYLLGRYLQDGSSELYSLYCIMSNICPKCFRQWGQPYYANHCKCDTKPKPL